MALYVTVLYEKEANEAVEVASHGTIGEEERFGACVEDLKTQMHGWDLLCNLAEDVLVVRAEYRVAKQGQAGGLLLLAAQIWLAGPEKADRSHGS